MPSLHHMHVVRYSQVSPLDAYSGYIPLNLWYKPGKMVVADAMCVYTQRGTAPSLKCI